jgi:hypothetical protein
MPHVQVIERLEDRSRDAPPARETAFRARPAPDPDGNCSVAPRSVLAQRLLLAARMSSPSVTLSVLGAIGVVGVLAFLGGKSSDAMPSTATPVAVTTTETADLGSDPTFPDLGAGHSHGASGAADPMSDTELKAPDEPAALTWTTPAAWTTAPNPSAMRVATYKVAHVATDTEDADVSVVRAGGTPDANIERWRDQFDGSVKETRTVKTVRGLKVTLVEINGTYLGGAGGKETTRQGWTLVAAIVETSKLPYFFKLTGATATVRSARPEFDALIGSVSGS